LTAALLQFEEFYEEIFDELSNYGYIEELHVCDNLGDHLVGNVYVKYKKEEDAAKCQKALHGRFYAGRPLTAEFSPVTDFREARCRQFDESMCGRGGYCNFMHIKHVSRSLKRSLLKNQKEPESSSSSGSDSDDSDDDKDDDKKKSKKSRRRSRSRSRSRSRGRRSRRDGDERKFKDEKHGDSSTSNGAAAAEPPPVPAPVDNSNETPTPDVPKEGTAEATEAAPASESVEAAAAPVPETPDAASA